MSESGKLAKISKLVNQFSSSIKHKPFYNDLDKARTLGFIHALRDVLAGVPKTPIPKEVQETIPLADNRATNMKEIKAIRNRMRGNTNELDGQD